MEQLSYHPSRDPNPRVREICLLEDMPDLNQVIHMSLPDDYSPIHTEDAGHLLPVSSIKFIIQRLVQPHDGYELYLNTEPCPTLHFTRLSIILLNALVALENKDLHNVLKIGEEGDMGEDIEQLFAEIIGNNPVFNRPTIMGFWDFLDETIEKSNNLFSLLWPLQKGFQGLESPITNPIQYFFETQVEVKAAEIFIEDDDLVTLCESEHVSTDMIVKRIISGLVGEEAFFLGIAKRNHIPKETFVELLSKVKEEEEEERLDAGPDRPEEDNLP
ncbi:hypothetical protein G7Y89_g7778 [Cudoniella acicularis]|uniref:Uncharacterized protein n=1 Tax=Cudoniella acicularis TaxID=354080 RepID=A0A8H4W1Q4_9HELO|nr:hypothetical protein G7Y89_g7778 [Cudoniella acicularis]